MGRILRKKKKENGWLVCVIGGWAPSEGDGRYYCSGNQREGGMEKRGIDTFCCHHFTNKDYWLE